MTSSDSVHIGLDGVGPTSGYNVNGFKTNAWSWSNRSNGNVRTIEVTSTGIHSFDLWMRESGMIVDKIVITNDTNYVPSGLGPDESTPNNGLPVLDISINYPASELFGPIEITLSSTVQDASIYYTLDGTLPTTSSLIYSSPFNLEENATVKAFAFKSNYNSSPVAQETFVISQLPPDLAHYWSFDEGNSQNYSDLVSLTNTQCVVCPLSSQGIINNALDFDGISQQLNAADDGSFDWASYAHLTIELWMKSETECTTSGVMIGRHDVDSQMEWSIGCENNQAVFNLSDNNGVGTALVGNQDIADGQWHHIVAVKDGFVGENRLYVDGQLEDSYSITYSTGFSAISNTEVNIGWMDGDNADYPFAGTLDDLAIHHRVLTVSQIQQHYQDGGIGLRRGFHGTTQIINIMPLGDSITSRSGYRDNLYADLIDAGYHVDFVGSVTDGDNSHEGHSGYTPTQIASSLNNWLQANSPDVVLLHIGTNELDLFGVEDILDKIFLHNPEISVILSKIINRATHHQATTDFNVSLESMALSRIDAGDKIVIVDHEPALNYPSDMVDEAHPNGSGYSKMADVWYDGLSTFLPSTRLVLPSIDSTPVTTAVSDVKYLYQVRARGYPRANYSLQGNVPAGMTIHPETGLIEWDSTVVGTYNITVEAQNTEGVDSQSFIVTVN